MDALPAGPFTASTRCLICRRCWRDGEAWLWQGAPESPDVPFAGYFCCHGCLHEWQSADEPEKLRIVFGDALVGLGLGRSVECGAIVIETEAARAGVLEFVQLGLIEATVYAEEGGQRRATGQIARYRAVRYRPARPHPAGQWIPW